MCEPRCTSRCHRCRHGRQTCFAGTSKRVQRLPAPDAPMRQTSWPGVTMPLTSLSSCTHNGARQGTEEERQPWTAPAGAGPYWDGIPIVTTAGTGVGLGAAQYAQRSAASNTAVARLEGKQCSPYATPHLHAAGVVCALGRVAPGGLGHKVLDVAARRWHTPLLAVQAQLRWRELHRMHPAAVKISPPYSRVTSKGQAANRPNPHK